MRAAEHGASFPMAQKVRESMSLGQLHDFAKGSTKGKPEHVNSHHPIKNLKHFAHPKRTK